MWRTVCRTVCILLALSAALLSLAGCGGAFGPASKPSGKVSEGQALFDRGIITVNNITTETIEENKDGNYSYSFTVSGLKDKAVEKAVNDKINALYTEMKYSGYIPPYRGIAVKLRGVKGIKPEISVDVSPCFNACNVLSVAGSCWMYYMNDAGEMLFSYGYARTLNLDLATGEELALGDIFAPGEDYTEKLSGIVDDMLLKTSFDGGQETDDYIEFDDIPLTAPFKGIRPDQKFYIDANGGLVLVMDYDAPEFYTNFSPRYLTVDPDRLAGSLALYRETRGSLYENETVVYNLAADNSDAYRTGLEYDSEMLEPRPHYTRYYDTSVPGELPAAVKDRAKELVSDNSYYPEDPDAMYDEMTAKYGPDGWVLNVYAHLNCERVKYPDILSVRCDREIYTGVDDGEYGYETEKSLGYDSCYLIDAESGELIGYEKLFTKPDRARELLAGAVAEGLVRDCGAGREQAERLAEELSQKISGACVSGSGLLLSYDIERVELYSMMESEFGDPDNNYRYFTAVTHPSYADIGCGNLVIFDGIK